MITYALSSNAQERMEFCLIQDSMIPRHGVACANVGKDLDAKVEGDTKKMDYYSKGISKFQRELNISVSEFPQFGLVGRKMPQELDSENYWPDSSSCAQTQKELEDYRLQELAKGPFRIEREPDLRKEQEEYFRRIRQGFVDPGSYG